MIKIRGENLLYKFIHVLFLGIKRECRALPKAEFPQFYSMETIQKIPRNLKQILKDKLSLCNLMFYRNH